MYCTECGAQIPVKSKFCAHCGHKHIEGKPLVKEKIEPEIIKEEITRQVFESHLSSMNFQFLRKIIGFYLVWILFHLSLLLIFSSGAFRSANSNNGIVDFWPFDNCYSGCDFAHRYDISEFLVYTIFPLVILIIISLTRKQNKEKNDL